MDFSISEMNFRITGSLNELQARPFATAQGVLQMHTSQKNRTHPRPGLETCQGRPETVLNQAV